jgi:hypothetical protein
MCFNAGIPEARTGAGVGFGDGAGDSCAFVHAVSAAAAVAVVNNNFEKSRRLIMGGPLSGNYLLMC